MSTTLHIVVHEPLEEAGNIALWARDNSIEIIYIRMYMGNALPEVQDVGMLAVMGGNMHTTDTLAFPWLDVEREWLGRIIDAKIPVIGICLGAQLIIEVLGGTVIKNVENEIGFIQISKTEYGGNGSLLESLPSEFRVFEWHGDKCVIPDSVVLLAESEGCECQAFEYSNYVLGVQFHPEYNIESVKKKYY